MDDKQLINAIEAHESNAETFGGLQDDRATALDYYLGKPLGNEVEGRSQVIARPVWDTVEWLKPQLADIFCSGDELVSFQPRGPEDVQSAEQETDYVNYTITQRNNWFDVWYAWSHDALVQKNGYVKVYWDDSEDITSEYYDDLTPEEFALLMQDDDIEIVEHEEESGFDMSTGFPVISHSVRIERKKSRNVVKIDNLSPESVKVDQNARGLSLQDDRVSFVEHSEQKTLTELRLEGFDVDNDLSDGGESGGDWEEALRDDYQPWRDRDSDTVDPSMRRVRVRECWIRYDYDGDGRAELRHVIIVGKEILLNEECSFVPVIALCPTPLPHQHNGLSVADAVMDLQRIQTALLRGALDNQYLANNGRYAVDENNVNLDDMLDSRPGGIVRVNGQPGAAMFPLTHPTNGQIAIPMMEYVDRIASRRTGVSEQTQGMNPDVLNNQAGATANTMVLTAAQQRIKFIARVFAETGIKTLFQLVHQITLMHSRQQEMVRLRGSWTPIDPRTWVKRNDLQISMTFGMGDRTSQVSVLMQLAQMQQLAAQAGLASKKNIYNTLIKITKTVGIKDVDSYWTDPDTVEPTPPPPDPKVLVEQMRQQADTQKFQVEQQMAVHKFQAEQTMNENLQRMKMEFEARQSQMELELQASNDARDSEREALKAQYDAQIEQMKIENERQIKAMEDGTKRYIAELDAQVRLTIAGLNKEAKAEQGESKEPKEPKEDKSNDALAVAINGMNAALTTLAKPKKIVRGPDGRAEGVE